MLCQKRSNFVLFASMVLNVLSASSYALSMDSNNESRYLSFEKQRDLDQFACKYHTDKGSWAHDYAKVYDFYFSNLRNKPLNFLEIGFASGASGRMWNAYFTQAELHFMDIDAHCLATNNFDLSSRCHYHVVDQANEAALREFAQKVGAPFDIIVDDGGHQMHQQLISFQVLFPLVKSGGVYIIEDLHTSYWQAYGGNGSEAHPLALSNTTIHFMKELVDQLNFLGARTGLAGQNGWPKWLVDNLNYYQANIESIHFYTSMCFIFKR